MFKFVQVLTYCDDDSYGVPVDENDTTDEIFRKLGRQILRSNKKRKIKKMKKD